MRLSHKFLIILCLSGTALSLPASAQDIPPAVAAVLASIERQTTIKPSYESIETAADGTVTISKLALNQAAEGSNPSVTVRIDQTVFANIADKGNGLYEIGSADFTNINGDISGAEGAFTFDVPQSHAESWYVRDAAAAHEPQDDLLGVMNLVRKFSTSKMTLAAMGQSVSVDAYEQTWDGDPATGAGDYAMKVTNIAIPETVLMMIDQSGMLKQLGYSSLSIDLSGNGRMDVVDDRYDVDLNFGITSRDMGTLKFGFTKAGISKVLMAEMQKAQAEHREPDLAALMPEIQSITVGGAAIRFEDQSITKKVLPMIAAMQGMDEATFVNMAGPMLQMGLMQLQSPALAEQATKAVNSFLKEPKSLTIEAKPATPVTVAEMMGMDPAAPAAIIDRLGVGVSAND
jgi:hypothetical protein